MFNYIITYRSFFNARIQSTTIYSACSFAEAMNRFNKKFAFSLVLDTQRCRTRKTQAVFKQYKSDCEKLYSEKYYSMLETDQFYARMRFDNMHIQELTLINKVLNVEEKEECFEIVTDFATSNRMLSSL